MCWSHTCSHHPAQEDMICLIVGVSGEIAARTHDYEWEITGEISLQRSKQPRVMRLFDSHAHYARGQTTAPLASAVDQTDL